MTRNIGTLDRILRLIAGLVLLALVFVGPKTPFGLIGLVLIATAAMGWCPPYALFGISTCKKS